MKVSEIALKEVYCIDPTATVSEAASMMKRHGVGALPVCSGDHLVGMITDRDMVISCVAASLNPAACRVNEVMTAEPLVVGPEADVEDAARVMAEEQVRRIPVADGDTVVGMLSLGDLARTLVTNDALVAGVLREVSSPA